MSTSAVPQRRSRASERARFIAAEIRVEADKKLGDPTPQWIQDLAEEGKKRFS
ncbi:hypothetical protein [Microbacterium sp. USHLN186]|uniref:hypothetical protein n=1 Tax=Microbacterium sp. USHLN186 TaxID=3081286 RepID=UPI0030176006